MSVWTSWLNAWNDASVDTEASVLNIFVFCFAIYEVFAFYILRFGLVIYFILFFIFFRRGGQCLSRNRTLCMYIHHMCVCVCVFVRVILGGGGEDVLVRIVYLN